MSAARYFLAVMRNVRGAWIVQPCERVGPGHWVYESSISPVFLTFKEANDWKRKYLAARERRASLTKGVDK